MQDVKQITEPLTKSDITSGIKTDMLNLACRLDILDKEWKIKPQYVYNC